MKKQTAAQVLAASRADSLRIAKTIGSKQTRAILEKAAIELRQRLFHAEGLSAAGRGTPFTEERLRMTLRQVEDSVSALKRGLRGTILDTGKLAADASSQNLIQYLRATDREYRGMVQPLAMDEAQVWTRAISGTESSILHRIDSNPKDPRRKGVLDRYGEATVENFEGILRQGVITRADWGDTRNAIIAESPFLQGAPAHWAERIVRTESMNAYSKANWEGMRAADDMLGDMAKILSATFDERTGWDSYQVHGQIRKVDEPFEWNFGDGPEGFMHPPNRPNDREVVVPHRIAWPLPESVRALPDGAVVEAWMREKRKGSPPPRPKMTTIDLSRFGKEQPPPIARGPRT